MQTANTSDIGLLSQHIIQIVEQLQQQLKLIKRRLPPDTTISNLGLNKEISENLYQCYQQTGKITRTLQDIVKNSVQILSTTYEDKGLPQEKVKEIAINASDKVYEQDDLGPVQSIKNSLSFVLTQVTQIAQFLQDNEYEINTASKSEDKVSAPIMIRAEIVRKELEQTKTLTSKLENKESEIKEFRKALKEKQEQLSEMTIRKELAEKKLGNVNKDYELTIEKLQRKLEEAHNNFKKKEKEFEETLDHLQTDIDSLENEKGEMKEKLKLLSKKALIEGMSKSTPGASLASMQSLGPNIPAVVKDSPMLLQEIDSLRKLFLNERNERIKLQNEKIKKQLESMEPLPSFKMKKDNVLDNLYKEGAILKQEILLALATPKFPSLYKAKPGNVTLVLQKHVAERNSQILNLKLKAEEFQRKVMNEAIKRKFGGNIETDFTVFPTIEMSKVMSHE